MKNKRIKKLQWIDDWRLDELEAWFSEMAAEGWQLINIGNVFVTFEEATSQNITYRCDVFKLDDPDDQARIAYYRKSGWEYVAERKLIHVFRKKGKDWAKESDASLSVRVTGLEILKVSMRNRTLIALLLLVLISGMQVVTLRTNMVNNFLNDNYITSIYFISLFSFSLGHMLVGWLYVKSYLKKIKYDEVHSLGINYKMKVIMKKWFTVLAILLLLILGVNMISNLNKYEYGYFTDDFIEDDQRPIMLVDLMSSSDYEKALQSGDNKEEENYYRQRTSILVPKQTEVYESVKVKDDTGAHRLSLFSTSYQGRYKWISERMVEAIKNEHPYPHEDYQLIDQNGFDEIWTRNDNDSASLIVRIENDVYRVEYETRGLGEDVQDRILKRMSELSF